MISLTSGTKGRMKRSGREFVIVRSGGPHTTIIRYRGEYETHEVADADLHEAADQIDAFSEKW